MDSLVLIILQSWPLHTVGLRLFNCLFIPIVPSIRVFSNELADDRLMLGQTEDKRRRQQMLRWLDSITDSIDMNLNKLRETVRNRETWSAAVHSVAKSQTC